MKKGKRVAVAGMALQPRETSLINPTPNAFAVLFESTGTASHHPSLRPVDFERESMCVLHALLIDHPRGLPEVDPPSVEQSELPEQSDSVR